MSLTIVEITQVEYKELKDRSDWLSCLETAGVDNWQGIDYANILLQHMKKVREGIIIERASIT